MKKISVDKTNLKDFAEMIPGEFRDGIGNGKISAIGMEFAQMPAGAAVWSSVPGDDYGRLLSLFVLPEFRGLDVGHTLFQEVIFDMGASKKQGLFFRYENEGERKTLTPFFNAFGFRTDIIDTPVGRTTLREAAARIDETFSGVQETGVPVSSIHGPERRNVSDYIRQISGLDPYVYMDGDPDSFVVMNEGNVRDALLFSRQTDGTLSLDFLNAKNPMDLAGLLKLAVRELTEEFSKDTQVEMILTTGQGAKLFKGLFGETKESIPIAGCRQSFKSL